MSFNLMDMVKGQLTEAVIGQMSKQIGANSGATQNAIAGLLPSLIGGLAKNASNEQGASSLLSALDRDHDGGIMDDLMGLFSSQEKAQNVANDGSKIANHIFGPKRNAIEKMVGEANGLNSNQTSSLLSSLAPLVMGMLGKQKQQQGGLDIAGLMGLMGNQKQQMQQQAPEQANMITKFLDQDGDGSYMDDVMDMGKGLLGNLFKK